MGSYRHCPSQSPGLCCRKAPGTLIPTSSLSPIISISIELTASPGPAPEAMRQTVQQLISLPRMSWDVTRCIHIILTAPPSSSGLAHAVHQASFSPLWEALITFRSDASDHIAWRLTGESRCGWIYTHLYEMHCQNGPIYYRGSTASHGVETCLCSLWAWEETANPNSLLPGTC